MSSFLVSKETIVIVAKHYTQETSGSLSASNIDICVNMANELELMNLKALHQRYGDDIIKTYSFKRADFRNALLSPSKKRNLMQAHKSIGCFLYQCSEGTVPEETLYKQIKELKSDTADEIVRMQDGYEDLMYG